MRPMYKGTMAVPRRAGAKRSVVCMAVACILLLAGCASGAETPASGESPGFNAGGPMEVHTSPSEAVREQIRVPDVEGEDWEDAAHTVLDAGFEFGNVVAVADRHPRWSVISQSPVGGSRLEPGEGVSLTLSMGPHAPESVDRLACLPEEEELDEPYCIGKLIKY
jgi:hypothetical protein